MNRFSLSVKWCALSLAVVLFGWSPGTAQAQTLYGITMAPGLQLISIDTTTGAGTLVAPLAGVTEAYGLSFRGPNLYVMDAGANRIKEINPVTGATLNTIDIGIATFREGDIAFRSDGMGFISGVHPDPLSQFDITVPNSTPIGPLFLTFDALAFNATDVLYGLSTGGAQLEIINQTTAARTNVGFTGIVTNGGFGGMAFDSAGTLFYACGGAAGPPSSLYRIDTTTGMATLIGPIGFNGVAGIAISTGPPTPGVTITQSAGATNVTEGGATDTYDVVLRTAPTANVTITINPSTQLGAAPATLTFTTVNWNVPQTVTVTAVDDALVEGAHTGTITHTSASADAAYNAIVIANVTANITDNDGGPPPPIPTPGGGIVEGNYPGSMGLANGAGGEGTFGLGRELRSLHPFLKGPHRDRNSSFRVFNVAHQQPQPTVEADSGLGMPGWALLSLAILTPAVLVYGRRRPA